MSISPSELKELIDAALRAESVEDIHALCARLCRHAELDHFLYAARFPTSFVKPYVVIISGYPDDWWAHYNANNYRTIDPVVAHCAEHVTPLIWSGADGYRECGPLVRKFFQESHEFGLKSGLSTPVHGGPGEAGLISLASGEPPFNSSSRIDHAIAATHLLTTYIHEAVSRVMSAGPVAIGAVTLTDRERECLLWSAEGKSSWAISQILGISENTVLFHFKNAAKKLNVSSRQQAVARAISMGLVTPQFT